MIKNYFLVAIRHLRRQPGYAFLNILGLTIGIASALLISLYLKQELSFDTHHEHAENVYRVSSDFTEPDDSFRWTSTQAPLGKVLSEEYQEVAQYTRFAGNGRTRLTYEDHSYFPEEMYMVDSTVFDVFTFNFLQGDRRTALNAPNSIVLSQTLADKIFKGENPVGKFLKNQDFSYQVTGVYEDMPKASHIYADAMASFSTYQDRYTSQHWGNFYLYTYVRLHEEADAQAFEAKINEEIIPKYVATIFDQFDIKINYELINILDIHLHSDFEGEPVPTGNIDYIYIFFAVAVFLILIACINYMNLATARSMRRSMEVGIRKVMGALRGTLIRQFIIESIVITLVSVFLSIGLLLMVTPLINAQLGTQLAIEELYSFRILAVLTGIIVVTGLLSGSYPAFYLSAFSPIKTIKGGLSSKKGGNVWVRRGLVGLQFAISMFMLVGTVIIYEQMQYVRNTSMGFDNEQVLTFELEGQASKQWNTLRNNLLAHPTITKASTSTTIPGRGFSKNVIPVETNEGVMEEYGIDLYGVDHEYFNVLSVELVAGRNFSKDHPTDTSQAVLVNEAMVSRMNWSNPIGKRFHINTESTVYHKVVGVVKNFHQRSFYDPINPLLFVPSLDNSNVLVKIEGDLNAGMAHIEATWSELFPGLPLEHQFLDQNFLRAYEEDQLRGRFFLGFACIMIIISGLGLLGLASFSAEQRTKEISIRKVLGANVKSLILLLIKDFLWLTIVGAIPAFIIGYQLMNSWLKDFEYHTEIRLISFIAVFLIVSIFVVLTTGIQAYRAAAANPSEKLKYE